MRPRRLGKCAGNVTVTKVDEWQVMGKPLGAAESASLVTGGHKYPSDIQRPG
jgi:hypothetical protein